MAPTLEQGYVKSETHEEVTTIEFFHPQSNSLPRHLLENLSHQIQAVSSDKNTKVIVLRSGGEKAFCAGASFNELVAIENEEQGFHFFSGFANVINAMRTSPKLIIGRIQGKCIGGGVGLAAAVDYAIAHEGSQVRLSELAIGIGPFVIGPAVERKIGLSAFSQLAIDATMWRHAGWAQEKGLFTEVHPTLEGMDESIYRLSNQLAHTSPEAVTELKKVFWKGTGHWDNLLAERAQISGRLVLSHFTREAIEKFKA